MRRGPLFAAASLAGLVGFVAANAARGSAAVAIRPQPAPAPSSPTTSTPAGAAAAQPPPTSTSTTPAAPSGTAVGTTENYGYGELAVSVSVSGGRIVSVSVSTLQTAEAYSQSLAEQVIPTLRSEVLDAQSARIDSVSGATYTSEAYAYSLQSALDELHFK